MFGIPDTCPVCGDFKMSSSVVCDSCRQELDSECFDSFMSRCPVCMYPKTAPEYGCRLCSGKARFRVFPVARYDGPLSYSVLDSFKFHNRKEMAKVVAMYLGRALEVLDPEGNALIVPVPCSAERLRVFGWDQMTEVCKSLGRPWAKLLANNSSGSGSARVQQKKLDRAGREEHSAGKFSMNSRCRGPMPAKDRKIIVVDDIVTTMSTMNAAIAVLQENGFTDVDGASWLAEL